MGIEAATHISDLVTTNPIGAADNASDLDNHIRLIKSVLKTDFASVSGAVSATHTELGYMAGVTSAVQTQLGTKTAITVTTGANPSPSAARFNVVVVTSGTLTLPASPTAGDLVIATSNTTYTIARNTGQTIDGAAADTSASAYYVYIMVASSSTNWVLGRG